MSSLPQANASHTLRWQILALLVLMSFVNYFNRISLPAVENQITGEYRLTTEQFGAISTAMLIAYTVVMTPGGWLIDALGAKSALLIMGLGTAACTALTGWIGLLTFLPALTGLLFVRALMGIFTAPLYPASGRMIQSWFPPTGRALSNGLVTAAAPIGGALAHPLFAGLADWYGWRVAFLIAGAITVAVGFLWWGIAKDGPRKVTDDAEFALPTATIAPSADDVLASAEPWYNLLKSRSLLALTVSYGALGWLQYILFYWIGHYFEDVLKYPESTSRRYSMIATMMMGFTMPLGGWVSDIFSKRWGRRQGRSLVASLGMVVSAIALIAATQNTAATAILVCFCLSSAAIGLVDGPAWATAVELGGTRGGTSAAIFNTGGNIGGFLATYLSAVIGESYGWDISLWVGGLFCFGGGLLWLLVDPDERTAISQTAV